MKKFWKEVKIQDNKNNTFQLLLDNKVLKTPMQNELLFTNYNAAYETLVEWDISSEELNTNNMVFYGIYSTAIDRVSNNRKLFVYEILKFIDTDLVCYRADTPLELCQRQNIKWNPLLLNIKGYINEEVKVFHGIMPRGQNKIVHSKLETLITNFSDLKITILYRMTNIIGSVFIPLCVLKGDLLRKDLFELCFLDELWQSEQWGFDEESSSNRNKINKELNKISSLIDLLKIKDV